MDNEAFCVIHKFDEMDDPFCFQDSTIDFTSVDASVQRILEKYLNQRIVYHQKAFKSRLELDQYCLTLSDNQNFT